MRRARLLGAIVFVFVALGLSPGLAKAATPGLLDPSFGVGGVAMQSFGANCVADAMAVQPDGRYVVAGTFVDYGPTVETIYGTLARYNIDGTLDTTFGTNDQGWTQFQIAAGPEMTIDPDYNGVRDVALLPGGGIVMSVDENSVDPELMRFTADGTLDTSFGASGLLDVKPPQWFCDVTGWAHHPVVVTPAGELLVGCTLHTDHNDDLAVMALTADGTLDPAFGTSGLAYFDLAGASDDRLTTLQLCDHGPAAGDILVGGSVQVTDGAIVRLSPEGSRDATFGTNGQVIISHGNQDAAVHRAVRRRQLPHPER